MTERVWLRSPPSILCRCGQTIERYNTVPHCASCHAYWEKVSKMPATKVNLMLDSGVFSAWNRKETLSLKRYIKFIKTNKKWLHSYVNMDKIPGESGKQRTMREVEDSAQVGYDNLQRMKSEGLTPIPVFHQGESFRWLERMINDGDSYIGISTAKDLMPEEQRCWLDTVFSLITNDKGRPLIKTHGFGITNPKFLMRYPWFTCDSTTWSITPGYGQVIVPIYIGGKPDYLRPPLRIAVTGIMHANKSSQKRQFEGMGPVSQQVIENFITQVCGLTMGQIRNGPNLRRHALIRYYQELEPHLAGIRFQRGPAFRIPFGLDDIGNFTSLKPVKFPGVTLVYATTLSREWSRLLTGLGVSNRLLSYYELKNRDPELIERYVTEGATAPYVARIKKMDWGSEAYKNHRALRLFEHVEKGEHE